MPPVVDFETGILSASDDNKKEGFYSFDPKEYWAPRNRTFTWVEGTDIPADTWHKSIATYEGNMYLIYYNGQFVKVNPKTLKAETIFKGPQGDCYGSAFHPLHPELLYCAYSGNAGVLANSISVFDITHPENGIVRLNNTSAPGHRDGPSTTAQFSSPWQICFDTDGTLYIADTGNHCIRKITPENTVETVVGIPGSRGYANGGKEDALFDTPQGLAICSDGTLYVADFGNSRIRKLAVE
jgi:streptogramin lyase